MKKYNKKNRYELFPKSVPDTVLYGVLIFLCLLLIGGLLAALTYRDEGILRQSRKEEKKTGEDQGQQKEQGIAVNNPNIRVLIMTNGYANVVHPGVEVSAEQGLVITSAGEDQETEPGQAVALAPDDPRFQNLSLIHI